MSVISLSSNDSLHHSINFLHSMYCFTIKPSSFIFIATSVTTIFIPLPIMIIILRHGVNQWRRSVSSSSAAKIYHSDVFTYHMAVIELFGIFGYILLLFVSITNQEDSKILLAGLCFLYINWYGQTFFHVLTCLERYLAVVHPITYMNLRNERGVRIRNVIVGCVWLLTFAYLILLTTGTFIITDYCFYICSLLVVFFCTISVLRALIRPGPGDQGGDRERVDQSKQRSFYTIAAILGTLTLRFIGSLIWKLVFLSVISDGCLIMAGVSWTLLPSSLVLPLLFLNKAGKLVCCKNSVR